jgi:hypothetical protein
MQLRGVLGQVAQTVTSPDGCASWRARFTFGLVDDRPAIIGLELWAADPDHVRAEMEREQIPEPRIWARMAGDEGAESVMFTAPITTAGGRLPLRRILDEWANGPTRSARRFHTAVAMRRTDPRWPDYTPEAREHVAQLERTAAALDEEGERRVSPRRPGRRPLYGLDHFEEVARIYRDAIADLDPAPRRRVKERMNTSLSNAAKWIARCRELGLLPPTSPGQAKGRD